LRPQPPGRPLDRDRHDGLDAKQKFQRARGGLQLLGVTIAVRARESERTNTDAKMEDLFLMLLRRFTAQARDVSDKKSSTYAPAKFAAQSQEGQSIEQRPGRNNGEVARYQQDQGRDRWAAITAAKQTGRDRY